MNLSGVTKKLNLVGTKQERSQHWYCLLEMESSLCPSHNFDFEDTIETDAESKMTKAGVLNRIVDNYSGAVRRNIFLFSLYSIFTVNI